MALDQLPLEVLDLLVSALAPAAPLAGDSAEPQPRHAPPIAVGRLAVTSRRLRHCCIDRAPELWRRCERGAFGAWLGEEQPSPRAAHASYSARMSCRVRVRRALRALRRPSAGLLPRPTHPGLGDDAIRNLLCVRPAPVTPSPLLSAGLTPPLLRVGAAGAVPAGAFAERARGAVPLRGWPARGLRQR